MTENKERKYSPTEDHFFEFDGFFRARYAEADADKVKLAVNCALEEAFRKLQYAGVLSEHSSFAGPSWSFAFDEMDQNPFLTGKKPNKLQTK